MGELRARPLQGPFLTGAAHRRVLLKSVKSNDPIQLIIVLLNLKKMVYFVNAFLVR